MMDPLTNRGDAWLEDNWDFEDWLLEAGEQVQRKLIANDSAMITPAERLVREVWLLDMEIRNGGVSQYFFNRGLSQWQALRAAWIATEVPSLGTIVAEIDRVIAGADDPCSATFEASPDIEKKYEYHQAQMKTELRRYASATAQPRVQSH